MSVAWVGGSPSQIAFETTSISVTTPSGVTTGDSIFVAVFGGSTLSGPSGWTKAFETSVFTVASVGMDARVAVFTKDSVSGADASTAFSFSRATAPDGSYMSAVCCVVRSAVSPSFQGVTTSLINSWSVTPPTATATLNGSMILAFGASVLLPPAEPDNTVRPDPPPLFTLAGAVPAFTEYCLAAAYRLVSSGASNSGAFVFFSHSSLLPQDVYGADNRLGAVTILLNPADGGGTVDGRASAAGPLGQPAVLARQTPRAGRASAASPLGSAAALVVHDFTEIVADRPLSYVADLQTPAGAVRVPISSWQATLQTEGSNFLQVVIPACEPYLNAINAATSVRVSRRCILVDGTAFEYQMASSPLDNVTTARGPNNYTATLSGYSAGAVLVSSPPSATARTLQDVRTIFTAPSGLRVRCAVDWLLRPAQIAFVGTSPFVVAFINYYVSDGDQYMDVGERVEPA